jgi:hypothetical protein
MPRDHHGKTRSRKAGDAKQRGQGTCTGAEQVLGLESCSGQIRRGGMTGRVHPSAVRKRERVSWASRWITDRRLEIAPGPSKGR